MALFNIFLFIEVTTSKNKKKKKIMAQLILKKIKQKTPGPYTLP